MPAASVKLYLQLSCHLDPHLSPSPDSRLLRSNLLAISTDSLSSSYCITRAALAFKMASTTSFPSLLDSIKAQVPSWEQIKTTPLFILTNYSNVLMFLFFVGAGLWQNKRKRVRQDSHLK